MTPDEAVVKLGNITKAIQAKVREAEKENLREGRKIAQKISSGDISSESLARMGHPYAKRDPNPPQMAAIINRQSGKFWRSWSARLGTWQADKMVSYLVNSAPYAGYLDKGTQLMIERPFRELIIKELSPIRKARLEKAVKDGLKS